MSKMALAKSSWLSVPPALAQMALKFDANTSLTLQTNYLQSLQVDGIVLAGFLLRVPQALVDAYPNRMVNIHPALLPKYGGKGMYGRHVHEAVKSAGETETGITIHYVNACYDEGGIVFQARCTVDLQDTPDDIARKVHELEYACYPQVIEKVFAGSDE